MNRKPFGLKRVSSVLLAVLIVGIAGCGGGSSSSPSPAPTPTPPPAPTPTPPPPPPPVAAALSSVALASASVVGGNSVQGTVTLTAAAAAGGAVVTLTSSNTAAVVPANVSVAAGATSATFSVTTTTVTEARDITITAALGGVSRTAALSVTPTPLAAVFSVNSASRGSDACALIDGGNRFDCTFDGRASRGNVREWRWEFFVGSARFVNNSSQGNITPNAGCGNNLQNHTPTEAGGVRFIQMEVRLVVADERGVTSPVAVNRNVRMFPNNNCGYGF